jgi:tRNA U34 5-methylaminomethyl-2-thiouridine-forming methyltransferase MnmC
MNNFNFELITTADGSPSIVLENTHLSPDDLNVPVTEAMHSSQGAFEESLYIYLWTVKKVFEHSLSPSFYSLGLGLGYNELILISFMLSQSKKTEDLLLVSSELHPPLVEAMKQWTHEHLKHPRLNTAYDQIIHKCSSYFHVEPNTIRAKAKELIANKKWIFTSALEPEFNGLKEHDYKFSGIFYDAFSENFDGKLWQEDFISDFLHQFTGPKCVFSTYAAKGSLKRALKTKGFGITKAPGFKGKREATFASRLR